MEEGTHGHGHRPLHGTGFHWLDISLALSAFFVSLVSLWLAIHNGRTMEKLVAANSYPNIDFVFGNRYDFGDGQGTRPAVYLSLANTGIGPARLRALQLSYGGQPAADLTALVARCCSPQPAASLPRMNYWRSGDLRGYMVAAGQSVNLYAWPEEPGDPRWTRLNEQRGKIRVQICYCSVFDECYLRDSDHREPVRAQACPALSVPYMGQ
jgi:hypothetical protein